MLHADTLFGDGPAKDDPGELRGLGAPAPIDPHSAADLARTEIDAGAATRVLLVDRDGVLQRTIRLPQGTAGWLDPRPARRPSPRGPAGPTLAADRVLRTDGGDHRPRPRRAPPVHLL